MVRMTEGLKVGVIVRASSSTRNDMIYIGGRLSTPWCLTKREPIEMVLT